MSHWNNGLLRRRRPWRMPSGLNTSTVQQPGRGTVGGGELLKAHLDEQAELLRTITTQLQGSRPAGAGLATPDDDKVKQMPRDASENPYYYDIQALGALAGFASTLYPVPSPEPDEMNLLYYWFVPSAGTKTKDTPLIIWLNGGPGASSMIGFFWENGPFTFTDGIVSPSECAWNQKAHVLYWDNPVYSGYSHNTKMPSGTDEQVQPFCVTDEYMMAAQFVNALQNFYDKHPEYRDNPLYISGESYTGKYIPHIVGEITHRNQLQKEPHINLKGMAIGDGWMEPVKQSQDQINYAYMMGIIDNVQKQYLEGLCADIQKKLDSGTPEKAGEELHALANALDFFDNYVNIYDVRGMVNMYEIVPLMQYMNSTKVKACFNVAGANSTCPAWRCGDDAGPVSTALLGDVACPVSDLIQKLLDYPSRDTVDYFNNWPPKTEGPPKTEVPRSPSREPITNNAENEPYKVLFYTGTFDMSCGSPGTEDMLSTMKWHGQKEWAGTDPSNLKPLRTIWNNHEAFPPPPDPLPLAPPPPSSPLHPILPMLGYFKSYDNVTWVAIPNAGHLVPSTQPVTARDMIYLWIGGGKPISG